MKHHLKKLRHSHSCCAITLVGLLLVGILHTSLRGGETSSTGIDDLLKGSWMEVELSPYTELARSILTSDSLLHEGQSTDVYEGRQVYVAAARLPWVKHICEIGFNGGASASLWLLANPNADVTMFDDWKHPYADAAERFLRDPDTAKRFRLQRPDERLEIIKGFSNVSLRRYAVQHTHNKCDLMVIDGGHSYREALSDITNMMSLANPDHHLLIVDDSNCDAFYCVGEAVAEHQRRGTLHTLGAIAEQMMPMGKLFQRGLTLHQYRGVVCSPLDSTEYRNFLHGRWSTLKTHREEGALKAIYPSSFLWKHASVIQLVRSLPLLPGVNHACVATQDPAAVFLWASLTRVGKVTWITSHPEDVALAMAKKQGLPSLRTIIAGEPIRVSLRKLATAKPAAGCNVAAIHGVTAVDEIIEVIDAFRHVMALGRHNAFLLIDESNCESSSCVDAAVEEHERRRTVTAILRVSSVFDASVGAFLGGATVLTMDRTSLF